MENSETIMLRIGGNYTEHLFLILTLPLWKSWRKLLCPQLSDSENFQPPLTVLIEWLLAIDLLKKQPQGHVVLLFVHSVNPTDLKDTTAQGFRPLGW